MKANEAPEKIHILPNAHDRWFEGDIPNGLPNGLFVEYIRTDAFIEKACDWFRRIDYDDSIPPFETTEEFIEGFKKAMKGE